jgi:hypothetical protein
MTTAISDMGNLWLFVIAQSGQSARELGYVVGQIAFYVLLVAAIVALLIWWRRRRR